MQPREDHLTVASPAAVCATTVHLSNEEGARVRRDAGEYADLGEDDMRSGLEIHFAISLSERSSIAGYGTGQDALFESA